MYQMRKNLPSQVPEKQTAVIFLELFQSKKTESLSKKVY